jgi:transposase
MVTKLTFLFPEALDDFVTEDNSVTVVDVFVEGVYLETLGFERVVAKGKCRPGYHPAIQLESKCNSGYVIP